MSDHKQHMYAMPAPGYGSYPGAERFSRDFGYRDYLKAVAGLRTRASTRPLSLYLHIPAGKDAVYLGYLKREIEMQGRLFTGMNRIDQLYLGGGPTMLSAIQLDDLMQHVRRSFALAPDRVGEYALEIDPRSFARERLASTRRLGFNRISMKVQVCDAPLRAVINAAREASFRSVSVALAGTAPMLLMAGVIGLGPDRIALESWGRCAPAFQLLGEAGYVYLGMGDFARPGDDLAIAQKQGRLHCNFQGYSTHADSDQVACGVSAISAVAATYCQNVKTLDAYYDLIDRNELPIEHGVRLDMDDVLRRTIIRMLMCQFELSIPCIEQAYPIAFAEYFAPELAELEQLARDGLVTLDPEWLSVTPAGRVAIGSVCAVFDARAAKGALWTA